MATDNKVRNNVSNPSSKNYIFFSKFFHADAEAGEASAASPDTTPSFIPPLVSGADAEKQEEETTPNSNLLSPGERKKKKTGGLIEKKMSEAKKAGSRKERARSAKRCQSLA